MNISRMIDKERSRRIRDSIRRVLMEDWDPIGVKDEPMAADEYDSYIGGVYELLKRKASPKEISDHLRQIEIERMGFADFQVPTHWDVAHLLKGIDLE